MLTTNQRVQAGGLSGALRVTELAPPSQPVSNPFVSLALKVYPTPENERNIAGYGGKGDQTSSHRLSSPSPFPKCGLRSPTPPPGAPHSRVGRREGLHAEGESEDSRWGMRVQPYLPGRGGAAGSPSSPGPRPPAPPLLPSCPDGPGPLSPPPQHVAAEVVPGQGPWVLADYSCPVFTRPGQPLGPLGHPQPVPRGSGRARLPSPGRQGALSWGAR